MDLKANTTITVSPSMTFSVIRFLYLLILFIIHVFYSTDQLSLMYGVTSYCNPGGPERQ